MNIERDSAADSYLDIDLDGVRLIEASAGTGKTFTLATLVTRMVVERGFTLGQILAVTFTEAATQELRARLRKRLALAADLAQALLSGLEPAASEDPETALTLRILQRQLAQEDAARLHARLRRAENEIDLASVFTIHGFCARVLSEYALQTGQAFDPPEMIGSERELHEELAADLWRAHGADAGDAELLQVLWTSPEALATDLGSLLRISTLLPQRPDDAPDPASALQNAFNALRDAYAIHGAEARAKIATAFAAKHFDGRKARATSFEQAWASLDRGVAGLCLSCDDAHLDKLTPERLQGFAKTGFEDRVPTSPLFDALADWFAADRRRTQWLAEQALILLYRIRDDARQRLALLKQTRRLQTYDDLIDDVANALEGAQGAALARNLRSQYAIALVDEFQDTDARQWSIFRRAFGNAGDATTDVAAPPALFLIGDPKQAIYGFRGGDVHTYLAAGREAIAAPPLAHNFRSRPGVLRAIEALYAQAGEQAFVDQDISFHPVLPGAGNADADYLRGGTVAPALTVRVLVSGQRDDKGRPVTWSAPESRRHATDACVAEIHAVLSAARSDKAMIHGEPVRPGDIAVLVRSHAEATRMQLALSTAGIPAVAAGKQSLFETEQAEELLAVFEALLQPADEGRLRAALATALLGVDAAGIARLDHDDAWRSEQQLLALGWRERWQRHGPLALVSDLCAANAKRLLTLDDGERRLTNTLQLGELLQEADARALGMHGLVDWLRTHIADADSNDEQQLLRLESDARRVQILTLHKAKGLEFPLVFLPYIGVGRKEDKPARHCQVPTAAGRVLHWKLGKDDDSQRWQEAVAAWQHEQRAEDARLLYVGLTRAEQALWLATGDLYQAEVTALAPMLAGLDTLRELADIVIDENPPASLPSPLSPESSVVVPPPRQSHRSVPRDWWVYSFTQLSKAEAGEQESSATTAVTTERGAEDEPDSVATDDFEMPVAFDARFSGSRFGNVLHDALEHVDFSAWRDWREAQAPEGQELALREALRGGGYADADLDDGVAELTVLIGRTLTVALPEGGALSDLPADARRAELEFHFSLKPASVDTLLATLHAHGVLPERRAFGLRRQLEGLMTGKIDLTYLRDGRWYLLDYKSNRLPAYDAASLQQAMAHSEYDLQALIYTLALHRWLRFRLGDRYDYARDFGGTRYLFCRGLDPQAGTADGLHAWKPGVALIDALDTLFAGGGA
ncbi:MAG: exodeoxyribonuclease V subunit beta [Pseudoxanthomonas sp.]